MHNDLPNSNYLAARSIYDASGFGWLMEKIRERRENVKQSILLGDGCDSFEEYQYLLGIIGGMTILEDTLEDYLNIETGEQHE